MKLVYLRGRTTIRSKATKSRIAINMVSILPEEMAAELFVIGKEENK